MTTTRYMMTPALMAAYALLDGLQIDDHFLSDAFQFDGLKGLLAGGDA